MKAFTDKIRKVHWPQKSQRTIQPFFLAKFVVLHFFIAGFQLCKLCVGIQSVIALLLSTELVDITASCEVLLMILLLRMITTM